MNNIENSDVSRNATDNDFLNQVIKAAEAEGKINGPLVEAVTFEDDPDEKVYLILLSLYPETTTDISESYRDWAIKFGRQETYDYLKALIRNELIDPNTSFIIAGSKEDETLIKENFKPETSPITVFRFMKAMYMNHKVLDDGESFDINEYAAFGFDENSDNSILCL